MELKVFLIIMGSIFTVVLLSGFYFIASFVNHNSEVVHDKVFDNLTELKKSYDSGNKQIGNISQLRTDLNSHFQQAKNDSKIANQIFTILKSYSNGTERVQMEKQDHVLIVQLFNITKSLQTQIDHFLAHQHVIPSPSTNKTSGNMTDPIVIINASKK